MKRYADPIAAIQVAVGENLPSNWQAIPQPATRGRSTRTASIWNCSVRSSSRAERASAPEGRRYSASASWRLARQRSPANTGVPGTKRSAIPGASAWPFPDRVARPSGRIGGASPGLLVLAEAAWSRPFRPGRFPGLHRRRVERLEHGYPTAELGQGLADIDAGQFLLPLCRRAHPAAPART